MNISLVKIGLRWVFIALVVTTNCYAFELPNCQDERPTQINPDSVFFAKMLDTFVFILDKDNERFTSFDKKIFNLAQRIGNQYIGRYYRENAYKLYLNGDYNNAIKYFNKSFVQFANTSNRNDLLQYYSKSSLADLEVDNIYEYLVKSEKLLEYVDIEADIKYDVLNRKAKAYFMFKKYDESRSFFNQLAAYDNNDKLSWKGKGFYYLDYARLLNAENKIDSANLYCNKAISHFYTYKFDVIIGVIYNLMGEINAKRNLSDALMNYQNAEKHNRKNNVHAHYVESLNSIGSIYLEEKEMANATIYYNKIFHEIPIHVIQNSLPTLRFLSKYSEITKDLNSFKKYNSWIDLYILKHNETQKQKELNLLESYEKLNKVEQELMQRTKQTKRQEHIYKLLIGVILFLVLMALMIYYLNRKKLAAVKRISEINAEKVAILENIEQNNSKLAQDNKAILHDVSKVEVSYIQQMLKLNHDIALLEKVAKNEIPNTKLEKVMLDDEFWEKSIVQEEKHTLPPSLQRWLGANKIVLSDFELGICNLLLQDLTNKEIAEKFERSYNTIKVTKSRIKTKFKVDQNQSLESYLKSYVNS